MIIIFYDKKILELLISSIVMRNVLKQVYKTLTGEHSNYYLRGHLNITKSLKL